MNFPRCGADTRVIETREVEGKPVIRRTRRCPSGHRFPTYESRQVPTVVRLPRGYTTESKRRWRAENPEAAKEQARRMYLRRSAREQAAETGQPVDDIYRAWGLA